MAQVRVVEVVGDRLADDDIDAIARFRTQFDAQFGGDDPAVNREWAQADLHPGNENARFRRLVAYDADEIVGMASVELELVDNLNVVMLQRLLVYPDHRYRDVGRPIVAAALDIARDEGRTSFVTWGPKTPASTVFWDGLMMPEVQADRTNRLYLADLDRELMEQWRTTAPARALGYELHTWTSPCPDDLLPLYLASLQGMNDAPTDDLAMEHPSLDEAWVRARERTLAKRGGTLRVIAATAPDGSPAAMTEVQFMSYKPWHVMQQGTTALAAHRGHQLGRWLKAEMIADIATHHPDARVIETGNAASNAPMLAINTAMGFRPHVENTTRQADVAQVQAAIDAI